MPDIQTYPHHKHIMYGNEIIIEPSRGGDLEITFDEIIQSLSGDG